MAIILKHLPTDNEYVFLGLHGGKPPLSPKLFSDLFSTESEKSQAIVVCDPEGKILSLPSEELVVIEVDGQIPADLLPEIIQTAPLDLSGAEENPASDEEEWI